MRRRRQQLPWIQRYSRFILGAIAFVGTIETIYLTYVKLTGGSATCPTGGCDQVLSSPYATVFGVIPLTVFGFLAYGSMLVMSAGPLLVNPEDKKLLRQKLEDMTWPLLFILASAMTVFSGYLMFILATEIKAACVYCIGSAIMSVTMLIITLLGRVWDDLGQLFFTGFLVFVVTLVGVLGVYSGVNAGSAGGEVLAANAPPPAATTSGPAEISLAQHLSTIGARKFGAYWCPHCHDQKDLFGEEAFTYVNYVECAPDGYEAQAEVCQAAGVRGYPSWDINGEVYGGVRSLNELADLSGYTGPRDFKN
ncbi:MAG: vitamin K epoxide reductase family protein [Cyanothece sp. SIO2G6]|nr:vitamin K epoxide reductase family protein [Cyanothece sp. SIO2G6]